MLRVPFLSLGSLDFRTEIQDSGAQCPIFGRALWKKLLIFKRSRLALSHKCELQVRRPSKCFPVTFKQPFLFFINDF